MSSTEVTYEPFARADVSTHELRARYARIGARIEEGCGQKLKQHMRIDHYGHPDVSCSWEDGTPWREVAAAAEQALAEIHAGGRGTVILLRTLSAQVVAEVVIAASRTEGALLDQLREAVFLSEAHTQPAQLRRARSREVLEEAAQILQGCTSHELTLPVQNDAHVTELARIVTTCSPGIDRDLTELPDALAAAEAALAEV